MNDLLEMIYSRKSVREYTDQKVEKEKIDNLLKAAMSAPSGMNTQPWDFVVVDDKEVLEQLGDVKRGAHMVKNAALAIVVCGNMNKAADGYHQDYWVQDCSAATENILLAAHAQGLGAVWTEVFNSNMDLVKKVREILDLPDYVVPLDTISIGYPVEVNTEPRSKYKESNVHYNKWK